MKFFKLSLFLIFSGIVLAIIFSLLGYAHLALFIIFPVIYSDNPISAIPFLLIFVGIVLLMLSPIEFPAERRREETEEVLRESLYQEPQKQKKRKKFGGVILIGPIPIIIGNDKKLLYIAGAIAIIILLVFLFYYL